MNMITIRLDQLSSVPIYEQLYKHIKSEIITGIFGYNNKLPSKRRLSAHLQCSQNTVQAAYHQLAAEGYIIAKPRSGFYVCKLEGIVSLDARPLGTSNNLINQSSFRYDFSYSGVDLDSFPFSTWRKITNEVINEYDLDLLKSGDPQGDFNLRTNIANYLHNSRGVVCSPNQVIISSGTEFLMQLLIQLFSKKCIFALENPGYEKLNMIFKSNHAKYKGIPLDENGLKPDELIRSNADVVCITPSHQFPTGNIMPISRRIKLLNWANEKAERYIIEDDYDSEFKFSGRPIPSLQGLDTGGKVIYMGSLSKSLTPAIRISYMVLPENLLNIYHKRLNFYICPVPTIEQKTFYRFINDGHFERHLNKMRNIYKKKRESLTSAIRQLLPDAEISGSNVGLHLILKIENGMTECELIKTAEKRGVKVYGVSQFYLGNISKSTHPSLLLGFSSLKEDELFKAVHLLRRAWY